MEDEVIAGTESEVDSPVRPRFQLFNNAPCNKPIKLEDSEKTRHLLPPMPVPAVASFHWPSAPLPMQMPLTRPIVKVEDDERKEEDAEAIVWMRGPQQVEREVPVKQEKERELVMLAIDDEEDDFISESGDPSLDDIDDGDWMIEEDESKENRVEAAPPSMSAGLRSLLPSPSEAHPYVQQAHRHSGQGLRQDEGGIRGEWWQLLPDFVPVKELARGIDPRNGQKVHILYEKQFTSDSASAHSRDKDKNLGPGASGVLYEDFAAEDKVKKTKKRKSSENQTAAAGNGSWYYSDGKKVFRDAEGNELTGKAAWRAYKGEKGGSGKAKKRKRSYKRGANRNSEA